MTRKTSTNIPALASVGIDIGKEVFHVVGFGTDGKIAFRWKLKRLAFADAFKKLPPCIVGMEACLSAHFVSRTLRALGHIPRIIPVFYVKPFVKGQKNDCNDAGAIAEAALRPNLHVVHEKTQDQLDLQACHRVRSRLVSRRTATINQVRAFLIEQGIAVRSGGAVSLTLDFLRFGAGLAPKLGNAHASSLVQTAPVRTRCDPAGRLAVFPLHLEPA